MSLRIDFTELAATQFYLLPHDVYAQIRAELVLCAETEGLKNQQRLTELRGTGRSPINFQVGSFEITYELIPAAETIRVLSIHKRKAA